MQHILAFKKRFDPYLEREAKKRRASLQGIVNDRFLLGAFDDAFTLLLHGGKRIRPYMAHLLYRACGGTHDASILRQFVAFEFFHLFALIHDDIIDRGVTRHGLPTLHRSIATHLKTLHRYGDAEHIGEGQAMLIGDQFHGWSLDLMAESPGRTQFFCMIQEVILGQMLDVDLMTRASVTSWLIQEKMRLKTASYTFIRPLLIGATAANGDKRAERFCQTFGLALGLAFQIQDDLFDLTLSAAQMQKTVFSDLRDRQHTIFSQHIADRGTRAEQAELKRLMGRNLTERDRPRVRNLFEQSGALETGERHMNRLFDDATSTIQKSSFAPAIKKEMQELVSYIRHRSS